MIFLITLILTIITLSMIAGKYVVLPILSIFLIIYLIKNKKGKSRRVINWLVFLLCVVFLSTTIPLFQWFAGLINDGTLVINFVGPDLNSLNFLKK